LQSEHEEEELLTDQRIDQGFVLAQPLHKRFTLQDKAREEQDDRAIESTRKNHSKAT
jgi:hypothetical protein